MKKRLISLLLAFSMALTFLPVGAVSAFAAETGDTFNFNGLTYEITSEHNRQSQRTRSNHLIDPSNYSRKSNKFLEWRILHCNSHCG